ncbi:cellulose-binding protein, partial [Streptomyces sp. SID5785]|nr:cellulose-binding protein [Streptomyces sp. SID5785]
MAAGGSPSPFGFVVVRGRGYRPEQVEARAAALFRAAEEARAELSRLTAREQELTGLAGQLRETVAGLAPQTYESLGDRARHLLGLVEEEAAAVRHTAAAE